MSSCPPTPRRQVSLAVILLKNSDTFISWFQSCLTSRNISFDQLLILKWWHIKIILLPIISRYLGYLEILKKEEIKRDKKKQRNKENDKDARAKTSADGTELSEVKVEVTSNNKSQKFQVQPCVMLILQLNLGVTTSHRCPSTYPKHKKQFSSETSDASDRQRAATCDLHPGTVYKPSTSSYYFTEFVVAPEVTLL